MGRESKQVASDPYTNFKEPIERKFSRRTFGYLGKGSVWEVMEYGPKGEDDYHKGRFVAKRLVDRYPIEADLHPSNQNGAEGIVKRLRAERDFMLFPLSILSLENRICLNDLRIRSSM